LFISRFEVVRVGELGFSKQPEHFCAPPPWNRFELRLGSGNVEPFASHLSYEVASIVSRPLLRVGKEILGATAEHEIDG
jgi:hypothetical protein